MWKSTFESGNTQEHTQKLKRSYDVTERTPTQYTWPSNFGVVSRRHHTYFRLAYTALALDIHLPTIIAVLSSLVNSCWGRSGGEQLLVSPHRVANSEPTTSNLLTTFCSLTMQSTYRIELEENARCVYSADSNKHTRLSAQFGLHRCLPFSSSSITLGKCFSAYNGDKDQYHSCSYR